MDAKDLISFWSKLPDREPYIHPDDLVMQHDLQDCQTHLFPQPWVGNLLGAKAFVMQLNPGYSGPEDRIERRDTDFSKALRENLRGTLGNLFLDDRFREHPGRAWTQSKFSDTATLEVIREQVALIELVPYHSKRRPRRLRHLAQNLASSLLVKRFLHENLLPRAKRGEIGVVIQRSTTEWGCQGMPDTPHFVAYVRNAPGKNPLGGYLTPSTLGGQVVRRHLQG